MKKLIIAILLGVSFCSVSYAWNLEQLRDQARLTLRDSDSSNPRWEDYQYDIRFAMAEEEFCRRTRAVKTQNYIVTIASQTEYSLPDGWIGTDRVSRAIIPLITATTRYLEIDRVTLTWLDSDKGRPFFEDSSPDVPNRFYINLNTQKIGLDPPPNVTYTGTNLIKHEYTIISSTMSADSDEPFDSIGYLSSYHKALIPYVISMCEKDQGNDNASVGWMQVFDAYVERAISELNVMITNKKASMTAR